MKKITFILFALIAGTGFAQNIVADAVVNAEIVSPLKIVADQPLEFGLIASDLVNAHTIEVSNAGTRTQIAGVTLAGGTPPQQAIFSITSGGNAFNIVSVVKTDLLITGGGTDSMVLTLTHLLTDTTLNVGGQLAVKAEQAAGSYVGEATVTVAYN